MTRLGSIIAAQLERWGGAELVLERQLFGTTDPDGVAAAVDAWCRDHLGAGVARYRFFYSSIGSVHGVTLTDGRAVVVKGHRPSADPVYIAAATATQRALAATGYPAPPPIFGPVACGKGHATAEVLVPQTTPDDAHRSPVIALLARGLADFVACTHDHRDRLARVTHPMAVAGDALYPPPHSARFDFDATAPGAEWIDDLASRARSRLANLAPPDLLVAHDDWRVENLSIVDGQIVAVYDWDSVALMDELVAVGAAALTFPIDWQRDQPRRFPVPSEIVEFIGEYETARPRPFTREERARLTASMVASLAYGARCEHADTGRPPANADSQRGLLAELGTRLLDRGLDALS